MVLVSILTATTGFVLKSEKMGIPRCSLFTVQTIAKSWPISAAYEMESYFKKVDIFLLQVCQLFKNNSKLKRLLNMLAPNINVTAVSFVKSHGTIYGIPKP